MILIYIDTNNANLPRSDPPAGGRIHSVSKVFPKRAKAKGHASPSEFRVISLTSSTIIPEQTGH